MITGGHKDGYLDGYYTVPKRDLVAVAQVLIGDRRLEVADTPSCRGLLQELEQMQVTVNHKPATKVSRRRMDCTTIARSQPCWRCGGPKNTGITDNTSISGSAGGSTDGRSSMTGCEEGSKRRTSLPSRHWTT